MSIAFNYAAALPEIVLAGAACAILIVDLFVTESQTLFAFHVFKFHVDYVTPANSTFTGWNGACTGTGNCDVTMSVASSVTANFAARWPAGGGMPAGFPGGMPQLPPGLDPNALGGAQGLPPGFKLPKLDFNKLNNPPKKRDDDKH